MHIIRERLTLGEIDTYNLLVKAVSANNADKVTQLMRKGARADYDHFAVFAQAVAVAGDDVLTALLDHCPRMHAFFFDALYKATAEKKPKKAPVLKAWREKMEKSVLSRPPSAVDFQSGLSGFHRAALWGLLPKLAAGMEKPITADDLKQKDFLGRSVIEILCNCNEMNNVLVPALWRGREAELKKVWDAMQPWQDEYKDTYERLCQRLAFDRRREQLKRAAPRKGP